MTTKHYNAIASALNESLATIDIVKAVADALAGSNPAFDRDRFIKAARLNTDGRVGFDKLMRA